MKLTIILSTALLIFISCTSNDDASYERYVQNGVRITENTTTPADTSFKVEFKEIAKILQNDGSNPDSVFRDPASKCLDKDGNLYLLDRGLFKIFKYSSNGEFLKSFGGQVQGDKKEDYYTYDIFEDDVFVNRIKPSKGPDFVGDKAVEIFLKMVKIYDY